MADNHQRYVEYAVSALRDPANRASTPDRVEGYEEQDRERVLGQVQRGSANPVEAEGAVHEALSRIGGYEDKSPYRRQRLAPTSPSYLVPFALAEVITAQGERDDSFVFDFEVREGDAVEMFEVRVTGTQATSAGLGEVGDEDRMFDWVGGHFDQLLYHLPKDKPALDQLRALGRPIFLKE